MKQVTGKIKRAEPEKQVSIQLMLGGHSFSMNDLPLHATGCDVQVSFTVLTAKTLLIPREAFEERLAANYLQIAGLACSEDETPIWSDLADSTIALMAANSSCISQLRKQLPTPPRFTSPLLTMREYPSPTVSLLWSDDLLYIKVYNSGLRLADVVPAQTREDLIFHIDQLSKEFPLHTFDLSPDGSRRKQIIKSLRHSFKKIV